MRPFLSRRSALARFRSGCPLSCSVESLAHTQRATSDLPSNFLIGHHRGCGATVLPFTVKLSRSSLSFFAFRIDVAYHMEKSRLLFSDIRRPHPAIAFLCMTNTSIFSVPRDTISCQQTCLRPRSWDCQRFQVASDLFCRSSLRSIYACSPSIPLPFLKMTS
ncbi:hypothetical protein F5888DRAFT_1100294 [Russula emetica]|nr:hypothetical protein F5888DRAFT_1100294 [Russula emetica]